VAHGWFPHVAKVVRIEENWLSESIADYASAVCLERTMSDRSQAKYFWGRQLSDWKSYTKNAGDGASVYLAAHLTRSENDLRSRYYLLYGKGPLVLHALRRELARQAGDETEGDRLFLAWIRSYVKNLTFKPAETRHLVGILNQMTGKDWQPWFERYVYGVETPEVR
jgi:aminopeptidase N